MKRFRKSLCAILMALAVMLSSNPVSAAPSSSGLSITPRKNYVLEPGKSITDKLTIGNLNGKEPLHITLRVIDFTFADESGTPKLMLAENAPQTPWSLKPFLKLPKTVEVPPGTSKTVEITVAIPADQGAGSYYSAIQYASGGAEGGNVNLNASGVTLAFVSVPGVVKEDMQLKKFGAFNRDPSGTTGKYMGIIVDESPSILAYTLKNNGNVAESPAGSMVLKDMFGNTVATIEKANPNSSLALIGQSRRFDACIKPKERKVDLQGTAGEAITCDKTKLKPGRYTATMEVFYGQNGNNTHEIRGVTSFWYLPMWFLMAVLAAVLIIAYVIWRIVRKLQGKGGSRDKRRLSFRKNRG